MSDARNRVIVSCAGDAFAGTAADMLADMARSAVRERGRCFIALSGGTTPEPVYRRLRDGEMIGSFPWEETDFFLSDERDVPRDHPESNYAMIRRSLFPGKTAPPGNLHGVPEDGDRNERAAAYGRELPGAVDLLLLGIGTDGHTASLFPGSPALIEKERRFVAVKTDADPPWRFTITPPVIRSARRVVVLARGKNKANKVAEVLSPETTTERVPARLARRGWWLLDEPAAADLPPLLTEGNER